jgi:16S rRNA (cytosine967-C5)-methyltransferase
MLAMLAEAPLDLRVNELKASREEALKALKKEKIECHATEMSPLGIRVKGRPAVAQTQPFKKGWIEIQDEGSQMVAYVANATPGMSVVDFCAGAGGKTLALAAQMKNKGRVIACDVLGGRLKRARERFKRAGLHNIEVRELISEKDDWVKRNAGKHDVVLVDAPCSGTGVWRRNPDARWKNLGPGLEELVSLQARILQSASRLVKPGGRLLYATCSLLPEENEEQVEAFLGANEIFRQQGDVLKLTPAQNGTDGFFTAVLKREN